MNVTSCRTLPERNMLSIHNHSRITKHLAYGATEITENYLSMCCTQTPITENDFICVGIFDQYTHYHTEGSWWECHWRGGAEGVLHIIWHKSRFVNWQHRFWNTRPGTCYLTKRFLFGTTLTLYYFFITHCTHEGTCKTVHTTQ